MNRLLLITLGLCLLSSCAGCDSPQADASRNDASRVDPSVTDTSHSAWTFADMYSVAVEYPWAAERLRMYMSVVDVDEARAALAEGAWTIDDELAAAQRNQHGLPVVAPFHARRLLTYRHPCPEDIVLDYKHRLGNVSIECVHYSDGSRRATRLGTVVVIDEHPVIGLQLRPSSDTVQLRAVWRHEPDGTFERLEWHKETGLLVAYCPRSALRFYQTIHRDLAVLVRRYSEDSEYLGGCLFDRSKPLGFVDSEVEPTIAAAICTRIWCDIGN